MVLGRDYFKGRKVTVMGLGLLGRGVGDTAFIAESGAEVIVTDMKSGEALKESLEQLSSFQNIKYTLGEHREEDFRDRDIILKAAGVPQASPFLEVARKSGAMIQMSGALFARLSGIPVIGITGTRGKSTVTHMIHHVLCETTEGGKVLLGGNVRGVSNLQLLKEVEDDSLAVMELDSWQLQGFGELKISPQVSVFTNFMEDHMNYYHGDMDAYFADKANIFRYQEDSGVLVTTRDVFERAQAFMARQGESLNQDIRIVDASVLPDDVLLVMPGEHNRVNAALATEALRATGLSDGEIFSALATFPGVPGRLELLGSIRGIKVYNDNNATTPSATIQGIKAVARDKNVILLGGGAYKEVDPSSLVPVINEHCKQVILLAGTGTDRLKDKITCSVTDSLRSGVELALQAAEPGDVFLFSPGFASFGMFRNEYDRNDQFMDIIRSYESHEGTL